MNQNKDAVDIICVLKSQLDIGWYFETDGNIGITPDPDDPNASYFKMDLLTTILHEIGHGLGLVSTMSVKNNTGKWGGDISGKANIYDTFLCDQLGNQLINESHYKNNSEYLKSVLTSEKVFWKGKFATTANDNPVKIHAPILWKDKNSICHIDALYAKTNNSLMNGLGFEGGNHQHTPGPIALGMLQDIGWTLKNNPTANENVKLSSSVKVHASAGYIHIHNANIGDLISIYDISGRTIYNGRITSDIIDIAVHYTGVCIVKVGKDSFKGKL